MQRLIVGGICLILFFSCKLKEQNSWKSTTFQPTPFHLEEPSNFVKMHIPPDNPLTEEGVALGEKLFFETALSLDSSISCASCHLPSLAFTDGKAFSLGVKQQKAKRSAMSLLNIGYHHTGLFWDGRVQTLEEQALEPVENPIEMASEWQEVERRLQASNEYLGLFRAAFGIETKEELNRFLVAKALAQYQRTLISANSKYDQIARGEIQFSPSELRGMTIFFDADIDMPNGECAHCHLDPLFTTLEYLNNGLDEAKDLNDFKDKGRGGITKNRFQNGMFKIPSLRNIELTAPYMHDGRFETLEEVIDHYNSGGHYAENANPNVLPLHLNEQDKHDLIAFLKTLTDSSLK